MASAQRVMAKLATTKAANVAGRHLLLFAQGGKITDVAWHAPQGVYWISNTLTTDISNQQMVSMAALLARG